MTRASPANVLLITSDQQHWMTLGVNNPRIATPSLDRLAAMGVTFSRAYCPNPTCTPTRASIITGMYPSTHGAWTLGTKLPEQVPTLGDNLRHAGYASTLLGKAHFQPLKSTDECASVEAYPTLRDLDFWRTFNDTHTPWYGFDHVETCRNHADEGHVGGHYALWLEAQGVEDWRAYFQPRQDGVRDTELDASKAPPPMQGPGYGWRRDGHWQLPEQYHYTTWTGQRTIAAIERAHQQGKPFFIWSSYHDPHPPYCVPEPWASMYDPADMQPGELVEGELEGMPPPHRMTQDPHADFDGFKVDGLGNHGYHPHIGVTRRQLQEAMAIYYGMISFMDHWIGRTLDKLQALGILDHTLVVFTSDHGHYLGQHGLVAKGPFHYEDGIRVPLLVAWPGRIAAGVPSPAIQSLVDLAPTFLAAAGVDAPPDMQGVNQLDAWANAGSARDHALVEMHHSRGRVHLRTLVTDRHKLTVYRDQPTWGELFDLHDDPDERCNRFDDPAWAAVRCRMYQQLVDADMRREWAPTPRIAGA